MQTRIPIKFAAEILYLALNEINPNAAKQIEICGDHIQTMIHIIISNTNVFYDASGNMVERPTSTKATIGLSIQRNSFAFLKNHLEKLYAGKTTESSIYSAWEESTNPGINHGSAIYFGPSVKMCVSGI
ncbi:MAG: hypothetical protein HC843_04730 [Sphingomonadales bacterium]|nr:hypothetical protein [Sphingomonadales bacterium]